MGAGPCAGRGREGQLLACAPCYRKSHSRGEYVFDSGWADAYERAGGSYYPKLQVSVPFTPATGRRLLVRPGPRAALAREAPSARCGRSATRRARPPSTSPSCRRPIGTTLARAASCSAPTSSSTGSTTAMRASRASWRRWPRASARRSGASAATRWPTTSSSSALTGADHHGGALGRVLHVLHGHGLAQMGPALPDPDFFSLIGERMADKVLLVMAQARRTLCGRRDQLHRRRRPLWPQLGLHRGSPLPAFRDLLLSGHRIRHRAEASPGSRRAPRASTSWPAATGR